MTAQQTITCTELIRYHLIPIGKQHSAERDCAAQTTQSLWADVACGSRPDGANQALGSLKHRRSMFPQKAAVNYS